MVFSRSDQNGMKSSKLTSVRFTCFNSYCVIVLMCIEISLSIERWKSVCTWMLNDFFPVRWFFKITFAKSFDSSYKIVSKFLIIRSEYQSWFSSSCLILFTLNSIVSDLSMQVINVFIELHNWSFDSTYFSANFQCVFLRGLLLVLCSEIRSISSILRALQMSLRVLLHSS